MENIAAAGTKCRAAAGKCDVSETCNGSHKDCAADAFASAATNCCSAPVGACNLQDTCSGEGACVENIDAVGTICQAAAGKCDVPESCNGSIKECAVDAFESTTTVCGPSTLLKYELQDYCSGGKTCNDLGFNPQQYSFKCGTASYLCGKSGSTGLCNDGNAETQTATNSECNGLIASLMLFKQGELNIYNVDCPNGSAVSNYVMYHCFGGKCEGGSADSETFSSCTPGKQFLHSIFME